MATDGQDPPPCTDRELIEHGVTVFVTHSIPSNAMEGWVIKIRERSGQRVDWCFSCGRAGVFALGDLDKVRAALAALMPEHDRLLNDALRKYGFRVVDGRYERLEQNRQEVYAVSMTSDLHAFVKESLAAKIPREKIRAVLRDAKWQDDEINAALELYADVDFPVPVPKRKPYLSAREAFIYLVLFLCLYISAFSFGSLLFDFVNRWVPDALHPSSTDLSSIRMAVASLIVAFPLYLWLSTVMAKAIRRDPDKKGSKIRKWLTYITLFVAAGVIIGDLITLLYNLLGGELTLRFTLKVLAVLLIAGLTFGYYLWDLRKEEKEV